MVNQRRIGVVLQYGQMALGIVIGILYTPIMIRLLGQSEYGLYNTVASTISMLSILNLGFNSGYIRYYAKYKTDKNEEAIAKLNGLFLIAFTIIGAVALLCGLFLSFNLSYVFDKGLTSSEYATARILMILLTLNLASSFPMGVFSHIISAHERFLFLKTLGMINTVGGPLITLPLLLAGYRSIAMVAVSCLLALFTNIMYLGYAFLKLKVKFVFRDFEKGLFRSLFGYTVFIALNMIVDQINWNIDKILLGRFKGTEAVAVYSVGFALQTYYQTFSTSVSGVFTPQIHRLVNENVADLAKQRKVLTNLFVKVGRVQYLILALVATGLIFFGKTFIIQFWAGSGYEEAYYVALLLIIPSTIALIQNLGIEIQRAENRHQFRSVIYTFMAVINLLLSIVLCQLYGAVGSAFGTAISLIVANGFVMNIYYHKKCNLDILEFWKNIGRMSRGLILPVVCGIIIRLYFPSRTLFGFLFGIFVYTAVYAASMWYLGMNEYEKKLVLSPVKKICASLIKR